MDKKKWWNRWFFTQYRLSIIKRNPYKEIIRIKISSVRFFLFFVTVIAFFIVVTSLIIAFSDLREYIPGYLGYDVREQMYRNRVRLDSLELEVKKKDNFFKSIKDVVTGDVVNRKPVRNIDNIDTKRTEFTLSKEEVEFRSDMKNKTISDISIFKDEEEDKLGSLFFSPMDGYVTREYNPKNNHYGTDIVGEPNSKIKSVMDGTVVLAEWTLKSGYTISIQHENGFMSVYSHNSVLLKQKGDFVLAGELISIIGNSGEITTGPHLHFELWRNGRTIDPEKMIKFKHTYKWMIK